MKSLKELYKIGRGPSSSHTMGPHRAACIFLGRHPGSPAFEVTLYGSLAATGKGHHLNLNSTLSPEAIEKMRNRAILKAENATIVPREAGGREE